MITKCGKNKRLSWNLTANCHGKRLRSKPANVSSSDATQIIDAIFDILDKFIGEVKIEDDITSVIIKMQN